MAMTNFVSTLCLVLLCSAILLGSSTPAAAQESSLDGTYLLDETDSDNINDVIETAVDADHASDRNEPPTVSNYHVQTSLQTSLLKEHADGSAVRDLAVAPTFYPPSLPQRW